MAGTLNESLDHKAISTEMMLQAKEAFLDGMHAALGIAGLLAFTVAVLATPWLPRKLPE